MGWDELTNNPLPFGGVLVVVLALGRWLWGLETDFVRKYSEQVVDLEAKLDKAHADHDKVTERVRAELDRAHADRDRWRELYYEERSKRWRPDE